jgi:heat shock protein HslJ
MGVLPRRVLSSAMAVITLAACAHHSRPSSAAGEDSRPKPASASMDLAGSSWVLEDLNGEGVIDKVHVTLDFTEAGRVVGNGSCNRYFATVTISGSSIKFGAVGATRMACLPAVSQQESKYFAALGAANRFEIEGSTLSIYGAASGDAANKPLRFTRATP